MKKIIVFALLLALVLSCAACAQKEASQTAQSSQTAAESGASNQSTASTAQAGDSGSNAVTMFIPLGNNEAYYRALAEKIETELGIGVEFVYQINSDTTDYARLMFANNALPADIMFTASKTDDALLEGSCLDLLARSSVTASFTPAARQECTTADGAIYQLPVSTKLIGITYNETLLQEMGWQVPQTFADMVDLKAKCDAAGILFAVADGAATGHGFNWLFHLMGAQWLSTFDGTDWLSQFQAGEIGIEDFMEQCDYFKRWTEAGLWGTFHDSDWVGSKEFSQRRALFWYGLTNTVASYDGPQLDENGNETGVELHDTYKTMPWISEDGSNNCFTYYDCCWVSVNKELDNPGNEEKLEQVLQILEYLATADAATLVTSTSQDSYVALNDFEMGEDRLYSAYRESISTGFIQPWYYNEFDVDSIVYTGAAVNAYIKGTGSYEEIFTNLDYYNQVELSKEIEVLADFPEGLGYEDTTKLTAISLATALNLTLEENGSAERVEVALLPYTPETNQMQPWKAAAVSNTVVFPGEFDAAMNLVLFPQAASSVTGIYMTGAQIKALVEAGFDPSDRFTDAATGASTFDSANYGPYPYVCLVKDGAELEDDREYLVAVCEKSISLADYTAFSDAGKVLTDLANPHTGPDGLAAFAAAHPTITPADLVW